MSPTASPGPEHQNGPRSAKGARTRERILTAAKAVFEEDGLLDARISDIAERAEVSHGSFYYYFESKEQIFREVAADVDEQLSAPLGDVILAPSRVAPAERIRVAIRRHFESYRDEAAIMGVIEQVSRYDAEVGASRAARHQRYRRQIADSIRHLQRRGYTDPSLDPEVTATALGALTYRFAELWLVQGTVDCSLEEGVDHVARIFVNVLDLDAAAPATSGAGASSSG